MDAVGISRLRLKVDRVVAISEGRELGRGTYTGSNEWFAFIRIDGKERLSPFPFMHHLIEKESDMKPTPKTKVDKSSTSNKGKGSKKGKGK